MIRPPPAAFVAAAPVFYRSFVDRLNPIIVAFGGTVSSWYRDPVRNRQVGGNPCSQHLIGTAADVVLEPDQVAAFVVAVRRAGFGALDEGDHVHVQALPVGTTRRFGLCF